MIKLIVLLSMMFLHIVDDFKFQGILSSMKQKSWWKKNYPNKRYKYDYIISLIIHAFSWDFMIHIPIIIYLFYYNMYDRDFIMFICAFVFNWIIHIIVDNMKANLKIINLVQDQVIHFYQIFFTFLIFMYC